MSNFVFTMKGVSKTIGDKLLIKDTWLSFIQGAKIGIIGQNGAGKSSLIKIIAGIDKEFEGEVCYEKNIKIGYLEQEPILDATKKVFENVMMALKDKQNLLAEFNKVSEKLGDAT